MQFKPETYETIFILNGKKIKCDVSIHLDKIIFSDNLSKTFKITNFKQISCDEIQDRIGLFKKHGLLIKENNSEIVKLYFENHSVCSEVISFIRKTQSDIIAEEKSNNEKYTSAINIAKKNTIADLKKAIEILKQIPLWKDSKNQTEIFTAKIKEIEKDNTYRDAISIQKNNDLNSMKKALEMFESIGDWKDSKEQIKILADKIKKKEIEIKNNELYDKSVDLIKKDNYDSLKKALEILRSISDWKESSMLIEKTCARIKEIENNNNLQYKKAKELMQSKNIGDIENAISIFEPLGGWNDSNEQIEVCKKLIVQIKKELLEKENEEKYNQAINLFQKNTIVDYEKAIVIFKSIITWKDSKDKIEACNKSIKRIKEASFWDGIEAEKKKIIDIKDDPSRYKIAFEKIPKNVLELLINNPYYVLGLPSNAEQTKILDVKDKIEKFSRLKLTNAFKSTFDMKNINKPNRDISSVQTAMVVAKEIENKWLWFDNDEYCCWWESEKLFEVLEKKGKEDLDYNLIIACYWHLLLLDAQFKQKDRWNKLFEYIDYLLCLPSITLVEILKKHSGENNLSIGILIDTFAKTIIKPVARMIENATEVQLMNYKAIKHMTNKKTQEALISAVIKNISSKLFPLESYEKKLDEKLTKDEKIKLIELLTSVEKEILPILDCSISIVGSNSTYAKRIIKKYRDIFWDSTTALDNNDAKSESVKFMKNLYPYCDNKDKRILRNTYGYDTLGIPETQLDPDEMNDIAIKFDKNGDIAKSIYWFTKAAEAGDKYAQSNLAFRYYDGKGVPQNRATAKMWWTRSANQGNETAIEALKTKFAIPHEHYDLGYISIGYGEQKYIEIALNLIAYVRVLDDYNFKRYIGGEQYNYYGGRQTQTPARIGIPQSGHWHAVVDNDGDEMGGIQSLSCYTKTRSMY